MKMVSMENESEEMEHMEAMPSSPSMPKYPYGLEINLNDESIEKLGIEKLPAVGSTMMIHAMVRVISASEREEMSGEKCGCMGLQITEMSVDKPKKSSEETLYGKK